MKRLDGLQSPGLALLALFFTPDDRFPVRRQGQPRAGIGDFDAVAVSLACTYCARQGKSVACVAKLPKQGSKRPWRLYQNDAVDIVALRPGKIDDGVMRYS